jgi:hypothetical protein
MWNQGDTSEWTEEFRKTFEGLARAKSWGGEQWERCVTQLIRLKKAWAFPSKGLLAAPNTSEARPGEVEKFMRYGRKWASPMELASEIGPRAVSTSFADRWWTWWDLVQPQARKQEDGEWKRAEEIPSSEWAEVGKMPGRNGMLLYVGGLLWWGEAAAAAEDAESLLQDWRCAVEDVAAVLEVACKTVGAK